MTAPPSMPSSWPTQPGEPAFEKRCADKQPDRWIPKNKGVAALKLATAPLWLPIRFIATIATSALNILSAGYFSPLVNRSITRKSGLDAVAHSALAILLAPASVAMEFLASAAKVALKPENEALKSIERLAAKMWTGLAPAAATTATAVATETNKEGGGGESEAQQIDTPTPPRQQPPEHTTSGAQVAHMPPTPTSAATSALLASKAKAQQELDALIARLENQKQEVRQRDQERLLKKARGLRERLASEGLDNVRMLSVILELEKLRLDLRAAVEAKGRQDAALGPLLGQLQQIQVPAAISEVAPAYENPGALAARIEEIYGQVLEEAQTQGRCAELAERAIGRLSGHVALQQVSCPPP